MAKTTVFSPRRLTFAVLGLAFVALGAVGVFLPGIPTVGPLLLASFFFTKSFPQLEQRLIRNRFFKPYLKFVDGDVPMPLKAKLISMVLMWASILASCSFLCSRTDANYWLPGIIVALGFVGTGFIANFQRNKTFQSQTPEESDSPTDKDLNARG
ncbi:MAG: YbaN family protein [Pirellulaceae bacterium]